MNKAAIQNCRLYERYKRPEATDEIMCNIRDWETVADRIYYIVQQHENAPCLQIKTPHLAFEC